MFPPLYRGACLLSLPPWQGEGVATYDRVIRQKPKSGRCLTYKGNHKGCPYKDYVGAGLVPAQKLAEWIQIAKCQHNLMRRQKFNRRS